MAMTLPAPASASADNQQVPQSPATPDSTNAALPQSDLPPSPTDSSDTKDSGLGSPITNTISPASGPVKRKPSRRANTAERRATHNAVERARRETLNSRFLDLAALLPNLSQIRRPSKSAIVNSSIAHIHASRRHRLLASRELRLLKLEADALRRELNEWRDRAGLPRVEEPMRGEAFGLVLSGEVEIIPPPMGPMDGVEGDEGLEEGDEEFVGVQPQQQQQIHPAAMVAAMGLNVNMSPDELMEEMRQLAMLKHAAVNGGHFNSHHSTLPNISAHSSGIPSLLPRSSIMTAASTPLPQSPPGMVGPSPFDVAMASPAQFAHYSGGGNGGGDYASGLFTPPGSANGHGRAHSTSSASFFANLHQRQRSMHQTSGTHGPMYGSPVESLTDEVASVGSSSAGSRGRSGSFGSVGGGGVEYGGAGSPGSEYGSFLGHGSTGAGVPRRMSHGTWADVGMGGLSGLGLGGGHMGMGGPMGMGGGGPAGLKAMTVGGGGGGNGGGYAMMM